MAITQKDISSIPTSKPLAWLFILTITIVLIVGFMTGRDIPHNISSLLSILGPVIIGGYYAKSGYEHRVDRQYGYEYTEPSFAEPRYPQMEETDDGSDEG